MKKTAQALRWAWAGLAFGLSPLYFMRVSQLTIFKVQLGLTEFGHWLLLPSLLLAWPSASLLQATVIHIQAKEFKRPTMNWGKAACLLATLLYASPALRAWALSSSVSREAQRQWPQAAPTATPAFSWKRLFVKDAPATDLQREDAVFDPAQGLSLTIWRQAQSSKLRPFVLVVHGGGWDSGQRDDFPAWSRALAAQGYVILDADYHLAPDWHWPTQRRDLESALAYARSNAARLSLDPTRYVIMGRSAGAHLALATAYLSKDPALKGVASFYGPADLFFAYKYGKPDDILKSLDLLKNFCGGTPDTAKAAYEEASPYFHVGPQTPPTFLAHGDIDALVWNQQSIRLSAQLRAAGRPYQFVELPWATHAFDYNFQGPSGQLVWYGLQRFLATTLQ